MPAHQFVAERVENGVNGEVAVFLGHLCIEEHLEEQVAEFLRQLLPVALLNGFQDLVGLFHRVFCDAVEGLFAIPGAAAGGSQAVHDLHRTFKALASRHAL